MQIYKKHFNGVIVIGNFDGLHLGHQKLLIQNKSKKNNLPFGVMTFEPVPMMFFSKKTVDKLTKKKDQLKKLKLIFNNYQIY